MCQDSVVYGGHAGNRRTVLVVCGRGASGEKRVREDTACKWRTLESHADCRPSGLAPASSAAPELRVELQLNPLVNDEDDPLGAWDLLRSRLWRFGSVGSCLLGQRLILRPLDLWLPLMYNSLSNS